jgi:hypothetical protein
MMVFFMKCAFAVCLLSVAVFLTPLAGQPRTYRNMEIDSGDRILRLSDEVSIEEVLQLVSASKKSSRNPRRESAPL